MQQSWLACEWTADHAARRDTTQGVRAAEEGGESRWTAASGSGATSDPADTPRPDPFSADDGERSKPTVTIWRLAIARRGEEQLVAVLRRLPRCGVERDDEAEGTNGAKSRRVQE